MSNPRRSGHLEEPVREVALGFFAIGSVVQVFPLACGGEFSESLTESLLHAVTAKVRTLSARGSSAGTDSSGARVAALSLRDYQDGIAPIIPLADADHSK